MATNYSNVNLKQESDTVILDAMSFDDVLTAITHSLPVVDETEVMQLFEETLRQNVKTARAIFRDNLQNVVKYAQHERARA